MPLLTIARLTLHEASRRRLLHAAVVLTIIVVAATGWGFSRIPTLTEGGRPAPHAEVMATAAALTIMVAYMFSFVLAVGAAFLAAPSIAADVESGLVLAMLPRPLRRSDLVLGKWLGLASLLGVYTAVAASLEMFVIATVTGYLPPHPVVAVAFLAAQAIVLLTLALAGSTRLAPMTGGIIALAMFGLAWIAGIAQSVGIAFHNGGITTAGTVVSLLLPTDGLWRGSLYNLEPAALVALSGAERANPFAVAGPPSTPYLVWALVWLLVMLSAAMWSFARRDL